MKLSYSENKNINKEQLESLYKDVQWYAYTQDLELLLQAINESLDVISAWKDEELVGLIRIVGDGLTIIYIQDILVLNTYQNQGIATHLLQEALKNIKMSAKKFY